MSTKSGQLRHRDFRQGVTAWKVDVNIGVEGAIEPTLPEPIRITGRPMPYISQDDSNDDSPVYQSTFCVPYEYMDTKHDSYGYEWWLSYGEYGIPTPGLEVDFVWRNRLFKTKKAAQRFVASLHFTPTNEEILNFRGNNDFLSALDGLPQPVYSELAKEPPKTFRNQKRFLRPPGQQLRRLAWPHDRAPTVYLTSPHVAYDKACQAHLLTRPAGSRPILVGELPHPLEMEQADHVMSLPGVSGRRFSGRYTRECKKADLRHERRMLNALDAPVASPDAIQAYLKKKREAFSLDSFLDNTAKAAANDLAHNPHKNGAGLVGLYDPPSGESVTSEVGLDTSATFQKLCDFCKDKDIVMATARSLGGIDVPVELFTELVRVENDPKRQFTIQRGKHRKDAVSAEDMQYYAAHFLPDVVHRPDHVYDPVLNMTTDPDTYKGLEDKGAVPTPPNEAS